MDIYQDWESLASPDEKPAEAVQEASSIQSGEKDLSQLLLRDDIPAELKHLINEHEQLQRQMDALTGKTSGSKEQSWDDIRFPWPQHSAKSRLRDKKQLRLQEKHRAANKKALEARIQRQRAEQRRELQRHLKGQERLRWLKSERHKTEQQQEAKDELKRRQRLQKAAAKMIEKQAVLRKQQRQLFQSMDKLGESQRLKAELERKQETKNQKSLQYCQTRKTEQIRLDRRDEERRERAITALREKRKQEQSYFELRTKQCQQALQQRKQQQQQFNPPEKDLTW